MPGFHFEQQPYDATSGRSHWGESTTRPARSDEVPSETRLPKENPAQKGAGGVAPPGPPLNPPALNPNPSPWKLLNPASRHIKSKWSVPNSAIAKNRFCHLRPLELLRQTFHSTQRLKEQHAFPTWKLFIKFAVSVFKFFFEIYSNTEKALQL